jgi:hypothetical protein
MMVNGPPFEIYFDPNIKGFKPWVEISYTEDFNNFVTYNTLPRQIKVYKYSGKITIGIPVFVTFKN